MLSKINLDDLTISNIEIGNIYDETFHNPKHIKSFKEILSPNVLKIQKENSGKRIVLTKGENNLLLDIKIGGIPNRIRVDDGEALLIESSSYLEITPISFFEKPINIYVVSFENIKVNENRISKFKFQAVSNFDINNFIGMLSTKYRVCSCRILATSEELGRNSKKKSYTIKDKNNPLLYTHVICLNGEVEVKIDGDKSVVISEQEVLTVYSGENNFKVKIDLLFLTENAKAQIFATYTKPK